MLQERRIRLQWVEMTIQQPYRTETKEDGTIHYLKPVPEHGGRTLRVVVNAQGAVVTLFFDRRVGRRQ
ncbi:MAG: DUF4258 domain-containing protein [Chloroflexi bacterium]|nr:DUF4258 domain-containing protein [Chloroflexota bacterium]